MPKFTSLRDFIATAISGDYSTEEITAILDNIEEGVGLAEHEKHWAEVLENAPASDDSDPVYQRGLVAGVQELLGEVLPWLMNAEWGHLGRCPACGWPPTSHKAKCRLDYLLRGIRNEADKVAQREAQ